MFGQLPLKAVGEVGRWTGIHPRRRIALGYRECLVWQTPVRVTVQDRARFPTDVLAAVMRCRQLQAFSVHGKTIDDEQARRLAALPQLNSSSCPAVNSHQAESHRSWPLHRCVALGTTLNGSRIHSYTTTHPKLSKFSTNSLLRSKHRTPLKRHLAPTGESARAIATTAPAAMLE